MPAAAEQAAGFFCQLYKSLALHLSDKVGIHVCDGLMTAN
jgi:hypothetical protein